MAPGRRLQALIRERTALCLDPGFREGILGETREEAKGKAADCERCLPVFRSARSPASPADLAALEVYEKCVGKSRP